MPLPRVAFLLATLLVCPLTVFAQQPADDDAADPGIPPVRIGPVTVTGSAWIDSTQVAGGDTRGEDAFVVHRARVGLAGTWTRRIGWNVSGELTADGNPMRNAFVVIRVHPHFTVRLGQATPPSSIERGTSPLVIEVIDRSRPTNQLTYRQDLGVTVSNSAPFHGWLSYALSVVNGSGLNRRDTNAAKDVVGRIAVSIPRAPGLQITVSGGGGEQPSGRRTRRSVGVEYDVPAWKVLVEALRQDEERSGTSDGLVGLVAYRLRPARVTPHFRMLEVAGRYVVFTDATSAAIVLRTTREVQGGVNYYVNRNVRVSANAIVPTGARIDPEATMIARLQVVF